jgi:arylsulfatase A-like enzyme
LFFFWALHIVHAPLQVPKANLDRFSAVTDWRRRRYLAMVNYMDDAVSSVVDEIKTQKMYDDTLIVFSADNGGPIYKGGAAAANNWPLRGGKAVSPSN